jgi:hypothetical protein
MLSSISHWRRTSIQVLLVCIAVFSFATLAMSQAQSNAADLQGVVRDPKGDAISGATVTARNTATNVSRSATTDGDGAYQLISLPPGNYEVTAEAPGFSKARFPSITLTVGQRADLEIPMAIGAVSVVVDVITNEVALVEKSSNTVANTIDQRRINDLPINTRDATGFALTISTVGRDNGRPIGPAPTSGLNIGGQRGRSTLVQVDGADNTDNSINASRSTVSQEAVQEYQVATNSYAPEFGRATGGIVNVVTKSGTNNYHGNLFGFIRHKSFQSRNALAPLIDNDPNKKPPFTRGQYGATIGGPIKQDRSFFFASFEQRRRQESGFFTSNVSTGITSSIAIPITGLGTQTFTNLTPGQVTFIGGELASGDAARIGRAVTYAYFASTGGQIGLTGSSPLLSPGGAIPAGSVIGSRFFISGAPVPFTTDANGNLIAFRALNGLRKVFPISESSTYFSFRADHKINEKNQLTLRFGYNPSDLSGIQDESQNQTLGQNDFSRTGIQKLRDLTFVASDTTVLSSHSLNEAYFQFGRRRASFDSQVPGPALQITGTAFMGSNPFSPVNRVEKRFQFRDNYNWVHGNHQFKFGGDINTVDISARFELNFPALFNFSGVASSTLASGFIPSLSAAAPDLTPVQSYGLGFPGAFIQGFGNPLSGIENKPIAFFAQDTWKIRNVTFNYGIRYDVELTDTIAPVAFTDPLTGIALTASDLLAAQDALGVQQGIPRDTNNWAPRAGLAWDINGNGKTVIRGAYGIFYDHPLLAVAFNSDIADGSQQQQYTNVLPGSPAPTAALNIIQIFQGTAVPGVTPGLAASAVYQAGRMRFDPSKFVGFGPVLPFTVPVAKNFEYAYASQANFSIERQLTKDLAISGSYIFVGAHHLPHPEDLTAPRVDQLIDNFRRFTANNPVACGGPCPATGRAPTSFAEAVFFAIPNTSSALYTVVIPSGSSSVGALVAINNTTGAKIVNPLAANFFRTHAPNYFFVSALTGGAVTPAAFNAAIAGSLRSPGAVTPFGEVDAQISDGNSNYNALNLELKKRFSHNVQFLASYTWSHSIDDSSDLQTLLKPQDNRNFRAERADSLFDQRQRFVFSGVITSPPEWRRANGFGRRLFADFTLAPIIEISSGRPFNILTATDRNGDQQGSNERPSVASDGTLILPAIFTSGTLARNMGTTHAYASFDMRLMRTVRLGERMRLDIIAEGFNLFNRFNEAAASPFFTDVNAFAQRATNGRYYSRSTAAFDPRQFQFGLKLNF